MISFYYSAKFGIIDIISDTLLLLNLQSNRRVTKNFYNSLVVKLIPLY